jgi:hypothetical protein
MTVTVTFDLEDSRGSSAQEERFVAMSHRFLEFIEERGITATVFIVGEIARSHPGLVRRVAEGGHEIGLHGLRHVTLGAVGAARLPAELKEPGFRAPIFSLTPATEWAVEQIAEASFSYSSSVLPAANPLHGWPGAPRGPCRWGNGLIELPCPVWGAGRLSIPVLGGIYLRYVPLAMKRRLLAGLGEQAIPWSYSHPYDIDPDEPFFVMPHANRITSLILHTRRGVTLRRLEALIAAGGGAGAPLVDRVRELSGRELPRIGT